MLQTWAVEMHKDWNSYTVIWMSVIASNNQNPKGEIPLLNMFVQIKEQHRGDQMTPGPKSQLLAGIVVDTIPGPVSLCIICKKKLQH